MPLMNHTMRRFLILALVLFLLAGCSLGSKKNTPPSPALPTPTEAVRQDAGQDADIPATTVAPAVPPTDTPITPSQATRLTVLYTSDEHGWMEGEEEGQGAAELLGLWREKEGYTPYGAYLILSGGDNWTGPAISTWFQGLSMVEVMNAMGYAASTIGNHEFDFGLDTLKTRISEASFPFVSANLRYKSDGATPADLGIKPYVVLNVNGLLVGITGLTTYATSTSANPAYTKFFDFKNYEDSLREVVPLARADGAQIVLVLGHVCPDELVSLAGEIEDLDLPFLGGGHCERGFTQRVGNTLVMAAYSHLEEYVTATFEFDPAEGKVAIVEYDRRDNQGGKADRPVAELVAHWREMADSQLSEQVGHLKKKLGQDSDELHALVVESWLTGYPTADVAITNPGGFREDLPSGPVTLADIIGVMPFDNVIVEVKLTGKQLAQVLVMANSPVVGGLHPQGNEWILDQTGQALDPTATYSVLVNDFLYNGGDGYTLLAKYDPQGYNTAIDWRQPVIDWIKAQNSTPAKPLDEAIQALTK